MSLFGQISLFLGHGRALETYLVGVKLLFALFIVVPHGPAHIVALNDLLWYVPEEAIVVPFVLIGTTQLVGLMANYHGYKWSWVLRFIGAAAAIAMWIWFIIKLIWINAVLTGMMPFCVMSCLGSVWLLWKAWNGLPLPGAVGQT